MPLPRTSLKSFLKSARIALSNGPQANAPLTFVIGNESADLDTLCTSVLLAYLRTYTSGSKSNTVHIPISNLTRADLPLRLELLPVLARANITASDFITLSDLPPTQSEETRIPPEQTRWILVDHNSLRGDLGSVYGSSVVGCIDHHDEEHKVPKDTGDEPRIIQTCGSCSSLVVEYCREAWDNLAKNSTDENSITWDAEVASLALGPVLIDTGNLTHESKTTPTDIESARYLERLIKKKEGPGFDSTDYWTTIRESKHNIDSLDIPAILRKDYKQWDEKDNVLGISSTVRNIAYLLDKAGDEESLLAAVRRHSKERDLSMCCIMASFHDGDVYTRELFLWAWTKEGVEAAKHFEADCTEELGLVKWNRGALDRDGEKDWRRCWLQRNTEHSRKKVAPLMRTSIERAG